MQISHPITYQGPVSLSNSCIHEISFFPDFVVFFKLKKILPDIANKYFLIVIQLLELRYRNERKNARQNYISPNPRRKYICSSEEPSYLFFT